MESKEPPRGGDDRGPLRTFTNSIRAAAAAGADGPAKRWADSTTAAAKAAIGTLLLSRETMTVSQLEASWKEAMTTAVEIYERTASAEAALLVQNFPGFALWRVAASWDRGSWERETGRLRALVEEMTGPAMMSRLTRNGLKVNAAYGPASLRVTFLEWLTELENAAGSAFAFSPESLMAAKDLPNTDALIAGLVQSKYQLIYDFPVVQEGLRLVAAACGWVTPFYLMYARAKDDSYKPLTRTLFLLNLVDQYFWKRGANRPPGLKRMFAADADALEESAMMSPAEANATKRTVHEVRVSAALSYGDPFVREVAPGDASSRIRSGPEVFAEDGPVDRDALAVHEPAVLRMITYSGGDEPSDDRRWKDARVTLADFAGSVLATLQLAQTPTQLLERLIRAGFLPHTCRSYDAALKSEFTKKRYSSDAQREAFYFDEAQQAVGCVAALGNAAFGLAESYGPGADYMDNYLYATGPAESEWSDFYDAVGLPEGALSSTLGRSMPPRSYPSYVKAARSALLAEVDESERIAAASNATRLTKNNTVRESLLLWFDRRAEETWGILPPSGELYAPTDMLNGGGASTAHADTASVSEAREAEMVFAAAAARYPRPAPDRAELRNKAFAKYAAASAGVDALATLASASFTAQHIATSVDVVVWARDYGGSEAGSFQNHRAKLNSLVYALLPFSGDDPQIPTTHDAVEMESLLSELHSSIAAAVMALPEAARPAPPVKPTACNSAFLLSMYVTAARLGLEAAARKTEEIAGAAATLAWSVADSALTLRAFFDAEFSLHRNTEGLITVSVSGDQLGTWTAQDLVSAIGDAYGDCADAVAEARVLTVTLRALSQDTARSAAVCAGLVAKAEEADNANAAVGMYSALAADYAALQDIQAALDSYIAKFTVGGVPVGLGSVSKVLEDAAKLGVVAKASEDPQKLFFAAVDAAAAAWRGVEPYAPDASLASKSAEESKVDVAVAVADIMDGYERRDSTARRGEGAVEVTDRYNVASPERLDGRPLLYGAAPPAGFVPASAPNELLLKERVTSAALIRIADSIFNCEGVVVGTACPV